MPAINITPEAAAVLAKVHGSAQAAVDAWVATEIPRLRDFLRAEQQAAISQKLSGLDDAKRAAALAAMDAAVDKIKNPDKLDVVK